MAPSMLACAAIAITVASALTLEDQLGGGNDASGGSWLKTDLPRHVVQAAEENGCGSNVTGYLLIGQGLLWSDGRRTSAEDVEDCQKQCDLAVDCVGFTARQPRDGDGKLQCSHYWGLVKKLDPRGMSFYKCTKGLRCADGSGYLGFQFSHEGSWEDGVKDTAAVLEDCSTACGRDRSCVGFTHRANKDGMGECYHYKSSANLEGPKRDMRANTYSKCTVAEQLAATSERAPDFPLAMAVVPKTARAACKNGYVASSKGWFWPEYTAVVDKVADQQACASACTSSRTCVSFVYRPTDNSTLCYMYNGLINTSSPSAYAFLKCPKNSGCDGFTYNLTRGSFKFSHRGHFEGGKSFADVMLQGCNVICDYNPSCAALSWQGEDNICSIYELKASRATALPADGAEGYSRCTTPQEQQQPTIQLMAQEPQLSVQPAEDPYDVLSQT